MPDMNTFIPAKGDIFYANGYIAEEYETKYTETYIMGIDLASGEDVDGIYYRRI